MWDAGMKHLLKTVLLIATAATAFAGNLSDSDKTELHNLAQRLSAGDLYLTALTHADAGRVEKAEILIEEADKKASDNDKDAQQKAKDAVAKNRAVAKN
jgi:hypothetical protein